jgi:hypothetical protein
MCVAQEDEVAIEMSSTTHFKIPLFGNSYKRKQREHRRSISTNVYTSLEEAEREKENERKEMDELLKESALEEDEMYEENSFLDDENKRASMCSVPVCGSGKVYGVIRDTVLTLVGGLLLGVSFKLREILELNIYW